jgi:hypothetical protein
MCWETSFNLGSAQYGAYSAGMARLKFQKGGKGLGAGTGLNRNGREMDKLCKGYGTQLGVVKREEWDGREIRRLTVVGS